MFEAGLFFVLMGIAFVIMVMKIPYREFLIFLSAGIFMVLSFVVYTSEDIAFFQYIDDGTSPINQTTYIVGDNTNNFNVNGMLLAFTLGILGIVTAFIGLAMWVNPPRQLGR